jgi:acyl-CoA thioesterase
VSDHPLDAALALETVAPGRLRGHTSPDWANMVGPFGGLTAALLLRAVEEQPDRIGEPVALTVNFAAPVADGPLDLEATAVRTNRSNQHWLVALTQDGALTTNATAVFGLRRDAWSDTEVTPPAVPAPEDLPPSGLPPVIVWARNFDMRVAEGGIPRSGSAPAASSTTTLWVRDQSGRALDFAALTALSDIFYPRIYLRLGAPNPAGTISLTTYFHVDGAELTDIGGDYVLATASGHRFARGYFDQSGQLWSRDGRLLVTTHQIVYYKT